VSDTPASGTTSRRDGSTYAAVIATLVGLLALGVSAYTAYLQRMQVRAQVWTHVALALSDTDRSLLVLNKGTGPARIESARVKVDGKPQKNWTTVYAALGLQRPESFVQSTLSGVILAANERLDFVKFGKLEDWQAFRAQGRRVRITLCYCSVLDECHRLEESPQGESLRPAVDRCERDPALEFTE
jgi:hypothetical protein